MKIRNYEKKGFIFSLVGILYFLELVLFLFLMTEKEYCYRKVTGVLDGDHNIIFFVDKNERNLFYQNKYGFFQDKKTTYEIIEDNGVSLKKEEKKYYQLIVKSNLSKKKKTNDIVEFSMKEEKKTIIEILKSVWEGD